MKHKAQSAQHENNMRTITINHWRSVAAGILRSSVAIVDNRAYWLTPRVIKIPENLVQWLWIWNKKIKQQVFEINGGNCNNMYSCVHAVRRNEIEGTANSIRSQLDRLRSNVNGRNEWNVGIVYDTIWYASKRAFRCFVKLCIIEQAFRHSERLNVRHEIDWPLITIQNIDGNSYLFIQVENDENE